MKLYWLLTSELIGVCILMHSVPAFLSREWPDMLAEYLAFVIILKTQMSLYLQAGMDQFK